MFLLRAAGADASDASETANARLGELVAQLGGLILMATSGGALIVTLPRGAKERLESSPLVGFIGPVHLAGESKAARALRSRFAMNAARQLAGPPLPPPHPRGNAG